MKNLLIILVILSVISCSENNDKLLENWTKMYESKSDLFKNFNELKFGMFIHWGVYSKLGGVWKGEKIIPETHGSQAILGEWIMHCARIPRDEYLSVAKTFNPVGFNAEEWVKLAKEAGMRYIVVMPKHHDGFAMYHSKVSPYNIYDYTPFKRDPIEEIFQACQKYGMKMGMYYSHSIDWLDGGDAGFAQAQKADTSLNIINSRINYWDPSPATFQEYIKNKAKPQIKELLLKFPNLVNIWYDFPRYMNQEQSYDFYKLAYKYQPHALINSRVGNNLGDYSSAGDNRIAPADFGRYKAWETPGTLNNTWGYKSYDNDWKSQDEILLWIAEIASKGANYLLNIGPDGNGVIPEESVKVLKEVGKWMKINGEAIYGTNKWEILKEGPTIMETVGTTHRQIHGFNIAATPEDFWFTNKDKLVYAISLASPVNNKTKIKSLYNFQQQIQNIKLLGNDEILKWEAIDDMINIDLPESRNTDIPGFTLKIELK